jgi:tetratricopeptide (TPR) repeat protein
MVFPFHLKVLYDERTTIYVCLLCLLAVVLLLGALFVGRKHAELLFSDFWFLLFLLPVVNIIPLMSNTLIADRYAYFSLMGFSLALAALLCKGTPRFATVAVVLLCSLYSFIDYRQNHLWKDDAALFARMTTDAPEMFIGYRNLALYYYDKGDRANAGHFLEIACTKPDIPASYLVGAASIFLESDKVDTAETLLLKALERDPANPEPYLLLNTIYGQKGNRALADSYLAKARQSIPAWEKELNNMAEDFSREGERFIAEHKYAHAANILRRALLVKPDSVPALIAIGRLCYGQGDLPGAARYLEKAIALDPSNSSAHRYLTQVRQERR